MSHTLSPDGHPPRLTSAERERAEAEHDLFTLRHRRILRFLNATDSPPSPITRQVLEAALQAVADELARLGRLLARDEAAVQPANDPTGGDA